MWVFEVSKLFVLLDQGTAAIAFAVNISRHSGQ